MSTLERRDTAASTIWLCDIDGTIALMNGRGPFEWQKVGSDLPNWPVIRVVKALMRDGARIIFVTGRMEECREQTMMWLMHYMRIWPESRIELKMRPDGDYCPDDELKYRFLQEIVLRWGQPMGVLDDRPKVVDMWRRNGLTVLDVGWKE